MYSKFFGFREKPFNVVPNPAFLYPSSRHRMALTYLEYGLKENIGFILLTGEIGTGKTTLIRHLLAKIDSEKEVAVLFNTNVTADDLLKQVLREFEVEPSEDDKSTNLDKLNTFLIQRYSRGKRPLLVIDEAQNLNLNTLEEVRMLSNLQTDKDSLLQIMLVGQPELRMRIKDPRLAQLAQRIAVSYHLSPLSREETVEYIVHRLKSAGSRRHDIFTREAMELVHEKCKGIPRSINILCDAALVYAYADDQNIVDLEIMEQTVRDREEEGVVPEGAVWRDPESLESKPGNGSAGSQASTERLAFLEARVADLSSRLNQQAKELKENTDRSRDMIVMKLSQMLDLERKKSDRFLIQCSHYKMKMQELNNEMSEKNRHSNSEDDSEESRESHVVPSKNGFFRRIFWAG